jgi:hypothetical protein
MAETNNRPKSKTMSDAQELYSFLVTPSIEVTSHKVWVAWKYTKKKNMPFLIPTNEVIGAYVNYTGSTETVLLSRYAERKAIYCDTDSVFYIKNAGNLSP